MSAPKTQAVEAINAPNRPPMNIIIPMGGIGARFAEQGYRFPKPLVNVVGRPMLLFILDNLVFQKGDVLWLAVRNTIEAQFHICQRVATEFGAHVDVKPIILEFDTRGAAETLTVVLQSMSEEQLSHKTISLDCDTVYFGDVLSAFRDLPAGINASFFFEDTGTAPIYSYLKLVRDLSAEESKQSSSNRHPDEVVDVKEKIAISRHANTGAYAFASAKVLRDYCFKLLHQGVGKEGEYYTSRVISLMLQNKEVFYGLLMPDFACLGTPRQLKEFFELCAQGKVQFKRKARICFDLDSTLVTPPVKRGDYSTCRPIEHNIRLAQALHKAGHTIIIASARRMKTFKGNVGAVVNSIGKVTLDQLDAFKIPHDEVNFGKPYADLYIDDLAVSALVDTEKEVGWLDDEQRVSQKLKHQWGFASSRSANHLQMQGNQVRKTSPTDAIKGELFYYQHIPADVASLFPKVIDIVQSQSLLNPQAPESKTITLVLEKINGVPFSLLMCNYCVDNTRLLILLNTLKQLHNSKDAATAAAASKEKAPVYKLYGEKIKSVYAANKSFFDGLSLPNDEAKRPIGKLIYEAVTAKAAAYESANQAVIAPAIHGDAVMSNILLTGNEEARFIDMLGVIGDLTTIQGDTAYDYAKVLLSLSGYELILHGFDVTAGPRQRFLTDLKDGFNAFIKEHTKVDLKNVQWITASIFFCLLPLLQEESDAQHAKEDAAAKTNQCLAICSQLLGL